MESLQAVATNPDTPDRPLKLFPAAPTPSVRPPAQAPTVALPAPLVLPPHIRDSLAGYVSPSHHADAMDQARAAWHSARNAAASLQAAQALVTSLERPLTAAASKSLERSDLASNASRPLTPPTTSPGTGLAERPEAARRDAAAALPGPTKAQPSISKTAAAQPVPRPNAELQAQQPAEEPKSAESDDDLAARKKAAEAAAEKRRRKAILAAQKDGPGY